MTQLENALAENGLTTFNESFFNKPADPAAQAQQEFNTASAHTAQIYSELRALQEQYDTIHTNTKQSWATLSPIKKQQSATQLAQLKKEIEQKTQLARVAAARYDQLKAKLQQFMQKPAQL